MESRLYSREQKRSTTSRPFLPLERTPYCAGFLLIVATSVGVLLFGTPATSLAASCGAIPPAPFPVVPGEAAATQLGSCGSLNNGYVVGLWDVRPPLGLPGQNWCAPVYYNKFPGNPTNNSLDQWTAANLGQVFGITFDRASPRPNIYVTPTTVYGDFGFPGSPPRGGAVYRLDGTSGAICVVATLPQPAAQTGLGDVCYDYDHNQLFVSDFDDGKIYRIGLGASTTNPSCPGTNLDWYDHGAFGRQSPIATPSGPLPAIQDNPVLRFTPRGRRVWAVQYYRSRLYYSVWSQDGDAAASLPEPNSVWSVGLDSTGTYDYSTARREFELPVYGFVLPGQTVDLTHRSYPISDIAFSSTGRMLVAERGIRGDTGPLSGSICSYWETAHQSRVLEYEYSGGSWQLFTPGKFQVGTYQSHNNSAGGVDYTCAGNVWASGDALLWGSAPYQCPSSPAEFVYGLQLMPGAGNSVSGPCADYFVDENRIISSTADKTMIGDVEIAPQMGSISGMKFNDLNCNGIREGNEPGLSGWTIIAINDSTGRQISTTTTGSGGTYSFSNLPLGTYTILEQQQTNYEQSVPRCAARTVTLGCGNFAATSVDFGNCSCPAASIEGQTVSTGAVTWQVVSEPAPGNGPLPRPANVVPANAGWCQTCGGTWLSASSTGQNGLPTGDYSYQYCFCLDPRFSLPFLTMCMLTDNASTILLNGNVIGTTPSSFAGPGCVTVSTSDATLFRPGENCIQIVVNNVSGPSGFNILSSNLSATDGRCCQQTCPCVTPPTGMIAWWPMYETVGLGARDIAGTQQNAVIYNGAGIQGPQIQVLGNVSSQVGAVGQALCLNGTSDYFEVPQSGPLNIGLGDFSVDAWIKTSNSNGVRPIVDKVYFTGGQFSTSWGYFMALRNGNAIGGINYGTDYFATGPFVADGKWHHLALSVMRSSYNGGKLYVDGVPVSFDPTPLVVVDLSNVANLRIGKDHNSNGVSYFDGCIDEVQFFGRALTAAEVYSIYAARARGKCTESCETADTVSMCQNQTSTNVTVTVCNSSSTPQTYTVSPGPRSGTGCTNGSPSFAPLSATITVLPYKCADVTFVATVTSFTTAFQTSCFQYTVTNPVTGAQTICNSQLVYRPDLCGEPVAPFNTHPLAIPIGKTVTVGFSVQNTGLPAGQIPYELRITAEDYVIWINGLPPEEPVNGVMTLPGPGGPPIALSADLSLLQASPFGAGHLMLMTDVDNDGNYEPLTEILLLPDFTIPGDMNCDEMVDMSDIPLFVQAMLDPGGFSASTPYCDSANADVNRDGTADGGDIMPYITIVIDP
jgi:hypothetical protein